MGKVVIPVSNKKTNMNDIIDLSDNTVSLNDVEYISKDRKSSMQYETEFDEDM